MLTKTQNQLDIQNGIKRYNPYQADRQNEPFYNTALWQRIRTAYKRQHPLCERCLLQGKTERTFMVHHIVSISEGGSKTDWGNLEGLCDSCHRAEHRGR